MSLQHLKEQEIAEFESLYGNKVLDSVFMFQKNWLETSYLRLEQAIREDERKRIEDEMMKVWDDMEFRGIKFCENDDWRNYKFVRNTIRDILLTLK